MNAIMTIQVRVLSAQALAQLKALEAAEARSATGIRGMAGAAGFGAKSLTAYGSRIQWVGRQLMYNFAMPLMLLIGLGAKWALDNEKAMVRVTKVYGDGSAAFKKLSQTEIPALQKAFEALSSEFGVNQAAVIDIAGDWAAAGASGLALAKVTKLTLETMVLGEMDATEATRDLIAIQAQYGMNTKQLTKTIDILNMVENQTGATMQDLIMGLGRAAGVAKTAGIDVEHLSAMMAALVPATGSAASAGNGLKTIISRLLSPTNDAVQVMKEMGIETDKTAWTTLNGTQRLDEMAKGYAKLSDAQKVHVASVIASRYQINRFSVLMDAVNNQNSYYNKSLLATSDRQKIYAQRVKELNQVLESNPQKVKQAWTIIQNSLAGAVTPLLPTIAYLAQEVGRLFNWFQNLNPEVQKFVLFMALFLISFSFATKYIGAFMVLVGTMGTFLADVIVGIGAIAVWIGSGLFAILTSPWTLAIAAITALVYYFRDDITKLFINLYNDLGQGTKDGLSSIGKYFVGLAQTIVDAWWALPEGIRNALIAVLTVIRDAALQVYEWMSYLNPWAHHSPSLVESVTSGMDEIARQYGRARSLGAVFAAAAADLAKFKNMMPKGGEFADTRQDVAKNIPKALPLFDKLLGHLNRLNAIMNRQEAAVAAQQKVVDAWQAALDHANNVLDRQSDKLDKLKDRLQSLQDRYDAAKAKAQEFANAPLKGMQAMSDAIFDNEMAQKRLTLAIMDMEDAYGNLDGIKNKLQAIAGAQELLRGEQQGLRSAGAGSEILGQYDDQIKALDKQKDSYGAASTALQTMQNQLDALQRKAQRLDLINSLQFDPLTRQIDQLANAQKELSFDEVINGIKGQQAVMDELQPRIDAQTAAVADQQAIVDKLTASRDALQNTYDREKNKLDKLNDAYQKTKTLISDIGAALRDMASAANSSATALDAATGGKKGGAGGAGSLSGAVKTFQAGAGGNFPDVGGDAAIGREGGLADQSAAIDAFSQQTLDDMNKIFGGFDMFGPVKKRWKAFVKWMDTNFGPIGDQLKVGFAGVWNGITSTFDKFMNSGFMDRIGKMGGGLVDFFKSVGKWGGKIWDLIGPDFTKMWDSLKELGDYAKEQWGPEFAKISGIMKRDFAPAMSHLWTIIKPFVAILGLELVAALKIVSSIIANVLVPVGKTLILLIKYMMEVIGGVITFFIALFNGDLVGMWNSFGHIVEGLIGMLISFFVLGFAVIWGVVKGVFEAIWGIAKWLYDVLVGHSIIPDLIDKIISTFKLLVHLAKWVWDNVIKPTIDFWVAAWPLIKSEIGEWWTRIKNVWNGLISAGQWIWDNVLKPVYNKFTDAWTWIKGEVSDWWNRIKTAWGAFSNAADWIDKNLMTPVKNAFVTGWNTIKDWFNNNAGTILSPIKTVVRGIVDAIDWIIKGLNKLDALPGVSISISEITLPDSFAAGGMPRRRVGGGFKTNGARAIVGEGKPNWPEYVIPTDPTYRKRAQGLLAMAASKIGAPTGSPGVWGDYQNPNIAQIIKDNPGVGGKYGIGGFLGDVAGAVAHEALDLGDSAVNLSKNAFKKIMDPMFDLARKAANGIDWSTGKDAAYGAINLTEQWLTGANTAYQEALATAISNSKRGKLQKGLDFARSQAGKPYKMTYDAVGPDYYDCSGFMSAVTRAILGQDPHSPRLGATNSFPWPMYGPVVSDMKDAMTIGSTPNYGGSGTGHMAGTLLGVNIESNGSQGVVIGGRGAFTDGNFGTHAQLALRNGGIVRRSTGGVLARIGEGNYDEAVTPLPRDWKRDAFGGADSSSGKTINIYGNLEFPNIKSGDDAETFVKNLQNLAKD